MRIIVSDSSCLIDLRKASLLDVFLQLPYEILIPNTLFEEELLKFTVVQKRDLLRGGLKVIDLPGERVERARDVTRETPTLSVHDGFAFALAESHSGCILLTGDAALRALAEQSAIEAHGLLWVIDQLHGHGLASAKRLHVVLKALMEDGAVRLPRKEVAIYIRRYSEL